MRTLGNRPWNLLAGLNRVSVVLAAILTCPPGRRTSGRLQPPGGERPFRAAHRRPSKLRVGVEDRLAQTRSGMRNTARRRRLGGFWISRNGTGCSAVGPAEDYKLPSSTWVEPLEPARVADLPDPPSRVPRGPATSPARNNTGRVIEHVNWIWRRAHELGLKKPPCSLIRS